MKPADEYLEIETLNGEEQLHLHGDWIIDNSKVISAAIKQSAAQSVKRVDASAIGRMDMWGSVRLRDLVEQKKVPVTVNENQKRIFGYLPATPAKLEKPKPKAFGIELFETIGENSVGAAKTAYGLLSLIGEIFLCILKNFLHPRSFRFHSIIRHIDETGFRALPIIGLLSILISMVISYQAATQLEKFGANIFTIDLTVISLLREMGVLVTAIMVAGRSGSAFAAEIGVMKLREEVDALKTMGMDPVEVLIVPRMIALMITLPILAFLADIIGLVGGGVISILLLDIPLDQYIDRVQSVATLTMFFVGLVKAPVFAFIITIIGTYQGMNVTGSAESVGRLTTVSVVQSIFLVIMVDAFFSILFATMDI